MPRSNYVNYVIDDLLATFEPVARSMFGGWGIKINGLTMAMIVDDVLYFKVDETNKADYKRYGSMPFIYRHKNGQAVEMGYWQLPDEAAEDRAILRRFVEASLAVARRKAKK